MGSGMSGWIRVRDGLPEIGQWVIILTEFHDQIEAQYALYHRTGEPFFAVGPSEKPCRGGYLPHGVVAWRPAVPLAPEGRPRRPYRLSPEGFKAKQKAIREYWRKRKAAELEATKDES